MRTKILCLVGAVLCSGLASCAWINQLNAPSKEKMLAAAGFQVRPANTPKRVAALQSLPSYQLKQVIRADKVLYIYPDPKNNQLYVGGPPEYATYQRLVIQQNIADENLMAAETYEDASMDWGMWGPFW